MEPFRFHVYACDQKKPEGAPSCPARGSGAVISRRSASMTAAAPRAGHDGAPSGFFWSQA